MSSEGLTQPEWSPCTFWEILIGARWSNIIWSRNNRERGRLRNPSNGKTTQLRRGRQKLKYHDITIFLGFRPEGTEGERAKPPRSPECMVRPSPFNWGSKICLQKLYLSSVHPISSSWHHIRVHTHMTTAKFPDLWTPQLVSHNHTTSIPLVCFVGIPSSADVI